MGMAVNPNLDPEFYKQILLDNTKVSLEEAIFRSEQAFKPSNLQQYHEFWEQEILKDHPQKDNLLKWIKGVRIEEFRIISRMGSFKELNYIPFTQSLSNFLTTCPLNLKNSWMSK